MSKENIMKWKCLEILNTNLTLSPSNEIYDEYKLLLISHILVDLLSSKVNTNDI